MRDFRAILQTQADAPVAFGFVVLADDPNSPDHPDPSQVLVHVGPLTLPGLGGPSAFQISVTLTTPFDGLPVAATFHPGIELGAAAAGTSDLIAIQAAAWSGPAGDNPRDGTTPMLDTIDVTSGNVVTQPVDGMTLRLQLLTEAPVLTLGADVAPNLQRGPNPAFGAVGLFPDHGAARGDGLAWRLVDTKHPQALVALMTSLGAFGSPLKIPGIDDTIWLDPNHLVLATLDFGVLPASGVWERAIPGLTWPVFGPVFELHFQAFVLPRAGGGLVSNAVATF